MIRDELRALVEELLDAHLDTIELATARAPEADWQVHLGYLRALLRRGQELLATLEAEPAGR